MTHISPDRRCTLILDGQFTDSATLELRRKLPSPSRERDRRLGYLSHSTTVNCVRKATRKRRVGQNKTVRLKPCTRVRQCALSAENDFSESPRTRTEFESVRQSRPEKHKQKTQKHAHPSIFFFAWSLCLMASLQRLSADRQIALESASR